MPSGEHRRVKRIHRKVEKRAVITLKRIVITLCILVGIFVASFGITCAVLYLWRSREHILGEKIMGSLVVEEVFGRSVRLRTASGNTSETPVLKQSLKRFLRICLKPLSPLSVEVLSLEEDQMGRLLRFHDRGALLEWSAEIPKGQVDRVEEILMNCEADAVFEPESVKIGLENMRSGRTFISLESFLLATDEEFDLRNIQFDTATVPKFDMQDAICPPLESPSTGSVEPISCTLKDHIFVGMTCRFSCQSNQTIIGNDAATCLSTGLWNYFPPVCSNYCPKLFLVQNGGIYPSSCTTAGMINPGTRCFYYCDPNYVLEGSSLTCSPSGSWKGATPFCRKTCSPISAPKDGLVSPTLCTKQRISVGFVCTFECDKGFTVSGSQSITCDIDGRWGGALPSCRKGCPLLRLPPHGNISPASCSSAVGDREEVMEGLVCVYYCWDGYILQGADERMCSEGGIWTEQEPECKRICGPVPLLPNMVSFPYSCQRFIVIEGTKCDLHCTGDFVMFGEVTSRTCLEDGTWRKSDAACYKTCTPVMPVYNGIMSPESCLSGNDLIREGTECLLECNEKFFIFGMDKVQCLSTGKWSGELGRCVKRCSKLPVPEAGNISPIECAIDGAYQGMHCEFSCREEHTLQGLSVLTCLGDGNWAGSIPTCDPDSHLLIQQKTADHHVCLTSNSMTMTVHKQSFDKCRIAQGLHWWRVTEHGQLRSVVLDQCMRASATVGSSVRLANCNHADEEQIWEFRGEDYDESVALKDSNLYMNYGYNSVPAVTLSAEVDENSLWTIGFSNNSFFEDEFGGSCPKLKNSSLIVEPIECVLEKYVANATVCQFSCHVGFKLYGDTNRSCFNGQWNNAYPSCRRACDALKAPLNGDVTSTCRSGLQDQSTICRYQCVAQHRVVGEAKVVCLSHGQWSYPMPSCTEVCPPLSAVTHGTISPSSCLDSAVLNGDSCTLMCNTPYVVKGHSTVTCRSDHTWSDTWSCARGCESEIEHGSSGCQTWPAYEGTQCTYSCDSPRLFTNIVPPVGGTLERVCQADGFFDDSMPRCEMTCPPLPPPDSGEYASADCTADLVALNHPCRANCTASRVAEGTACRVECDTGFRFRGKSPSVVCTSDGQWGYEDFVCEEELQFTMFNDDTFPAVCARLDDYELGSLLKKDDLNVGRCYYLHAGTLYNWDGDLIKHIRSGLCLAVQDLTTESFSLVLVKECDADDASQHWDCEHEYLLKVRSKPLYLSASSTDHPFLIVKDMGVTLIKSDFMWKSIPTKNFSSTNVGGACYTKLKKCSSFDELPNGAVTPFSCKSGTLYEGAVCNLVCDSGYLLRKVLLKSLSVKCLSHGAWRADVTLPADTLPPACLKKCPPLSHPVNGTLETADICTLGNSTVYGTVCLFSCDLYHELKGVDVLVCGDDGTWSHPQPTCRAKCYHEPLIVGNHNESPYKEQPAIRGCMDVVEQWTQVLEGVTCSYYCAGGMHVLSGALHRTCNSSGEFDLPVGECQFPVSGSYVLGNCPSPPGTPVSTYSCSLNVTDSTTERVCANYTCEPGYYMNGSSVLHCNVIDYSWADPPTCLRKCEDIGTDCVDVIVGEACTINCFSRQTYSHGNGIMLCLKGGVWNDTAPTCVGVSDFFISTIVAPPTKLCVASTDAPYLNSIISAESCSGRPRTRWMWKNDYTLLHSTSAMCLTATSVKHGARLYITFCDPANQLQQWECSTDLEKPMLIRSRFHPTLVLATTRALADYTTFTYNLLLVHLKFLGHGDYEFANWFTMTSSTESTLCAVRQSDAKCPPLKSAVPKGIGFSPATCLEEWSPEGKPCFWFCEAGQESATYTAALCENGRWNTTTFSCIRGCPALDEPKNGNLTDCVPGSDSFEGMACTAECDKGYYSVWEPTRVCQWDGTWSGKEFQCGKSCDPLVQPQHVVIEPERCLSNDQRPIKGTICMYSCVDMYHMTSNENTRTCLESGAWSGEETHCVRVCSPLPPVAHGSISPSTCSTPPLPAGTVCTVACDFGYQIVGLDTRECLDDGTWTNILSDNEKICLSQCKPFTVPENSQLSCSFDKSTVGLMSSFYPESTECRILCDADFAIDGSWIRTCHGTGEWSGDDPYCYPELQFLIFLSKRNGSEDNVKICVAASADDAVVKVEVSECDSYNPFHRWSWFSSSLLKNSGSGKCMGIATPYPGQRLEMLPCNSTDTVQDWSCHSDSAEWFLRMHQHKLYPDFGYVTIETLWVYDLDLYNIKEDNIMWYSLPASEYTKGTENHNLRATVCAMRKKDMGGVCSPLIQPEHGRIFPSICSADNHEILPGLVCSYKCEIGYKPDIPEMTLTCQENGMWSGPALKCEGFCPLLNLMPHMVIHPSSCSHNDKDLEMSVSKSDGVLPGGICTVSCEEGYMLEGGKETKITCLESGRWNEEPQECKRICPSIPRIRHAFTTPSSCSTEEQIKGALCALECEPGFVIDLAQRTCPDFAELNFTDPNITEIAAESCVVEEKPSIFIQKLTKLCMTDGTWSGDSVECVSVCPPPVLPWHGQIVPPLCTDSLVKEGTVCTYVCDDGFMIKGDPNRVCESGAWVLESALVHGDWEAGMDAPLESDATPVCQRYCVAETKNNSYTFVTPAECNMERIQVDTACTTSCHSDYILVGHMKTTCLKDGSWDGTPAKCIKKCSALVPLENGAVLPLACTTASLGSGAICTYSCPNQFALVGSITTVCNEAGFWSHSPPECKRRCFPLAKIYNGEAYPAASCYGEHITVRDICYFSCHEGFMLEGYEMTMCQPDGQWDMPIPKCVRTCAPFSIAKGTVKCTTTHNTWGTKCKILCDSGLAPSSLSTVTCSSSGSWSPKFPECIETGVPMYIMQRLDGNSVCLMENDEGDVVRALKEVCLTALQSDIKAYQWRWLHGHNIQNTASGRCMSVHFVRGDEPVVTSPCDTSDPLQWWECSTENPFRLLLRDTEYSPSTYIQNSDSLVLQLWSDAHSYFSTLNLNTLSFSSLCSRRSGGACPSLTDIPGGFVDEDCKTDNVAVGQMCVYQCKDGTDTLVGEPLTQCMGNGLWMVPPPKCVGGCPLLDDTLPPHTYYEDPVCVFDEPQVGQVCTASCLDGYELRGNPNRTCLGSGSWSQRLFECRKLCPVIFGILDGKTDPLPCRSISCIFTCHPGYVLDGARILTCFEDGDWDKPIPQCIRDAQFQIISLDVRHPSLCVTVEENKPAMKSKCVVGMASQLFKWIQNSKLLRNTASGMCLTGSPKRWGEVTLKSCDQDNGLQTWECGSDPNSQVNSLRIGSWGDIFYLDIGATNSDAKLVMETRYYPSSHWLAKHYFSEGTVCSMRGIGVCSPLVLPQQSHLSPQQCTNHTTVQEGLVCSVSCDDGYEIDGITHTTCLPEGKWSPVPSCKGGYKCEPPVFQSPSVQTTPGYCKEGTVSSGETCRFYCEEGFQLYGPKQIECQDGGMWSGGPPTCVQLCPPLHLPNHMLVDPAWCLGGNSPADAECRFSCNKGFKLVGYQLRTCKSDGLWSGDEAQCLRLCSRLSSPRHGKVFPTRCDSDESTEGTICQFQCDPEYGMEGAKETACIGGRWTNTIPTCVVLNACPAVASSAGCDMKVSYEKLFNDVSVVAGTTITMTCGAFCSLVSKPDTRVCLDDGSWSGGTPACIKMCPPVKVPFGVLTRPSDCSYAWKVYGSICESTCARQTTSGGVKEIQCEEGGEWSSEFGACTKSVLDEDVLSEPFMIWQRYEGETDVCLQSDFANLSVVSVSAERCSDMNLLQLWAWHGPKRIRSVSAGMCWTPERRDGEIILGLGKCSAQRTSQVFKCGNIRSQEHRLQLTSENMQVWNRGSGLIQLTTSTLIYGLNWESRLVTQKSWTKNEIVPTHHSVCEPLCGGDTTTSSGTFSSPGYPDPYMQNLICDWTIDLPNKKIYLWIHHVDIGQGITSEEGQCIGDHLMILDGDDMHLHDSNVLGKICGKRRTNIGPFVSRHGKLAIRFVSDDTAGTATGFTATWDSEPFPESSQVCGFAKPLEAEAAGNVSASERRVKQVSGRLVGGEAADVTDVSWYASLVSLQEQRHLCGLTFVHPLYLLTAAHCVSGIDDDSVSEYVVGYGAPYKRLMLNLVKELLSSAGSEAAFVKSADGTTLVRIKELHVHPQFEDNVENDVAIIKIAEESPITYSAACIPPLRKEGSAYNFGHIESVKDYCAVAGWDSEKKGGVSALHRIKLPVVSDHQCQEVSVKSFGREVNTTAVLCAAHFDGNQQTVCDGDDGSGLICNWNGNYYVVGIASFQLARCGLLNVPKYFVRVATCQAWIEEIVGDVS